MVTYCRMTRQPYTTRKLTWTQFTGLIQIPPLHVILGGRCLVLCNFIICVDLCNHQHSPNTEQVLPFYRYLTWNLGQQGHGGWFLSVLRRCFSTNFWFVFLFSDKKSLVILTFIPVYITSFFLWLL